MLGAQKGKKGVRVNKDGFLEEYNGDLITQV